MIKSRLFLAFLVFAPLPALAQDAPSLADLAFLEGHWRGGTDTIVFEETWSAPEGGVMTAMARGVSAGEAPGKLRVLEYVVVAEEAAGVVMRFKHFNADYSSWEAGGPVTLTLTSAKPDDLTFTADPPSESVKSARFWKPGDNTLQVDVVVIEDGAQGGFTLVFERVE